MGIQLLGRGKVVSNVLVINCQDLLKFSFSGPSSTVRNVSGNRCGSVCRSRGRELDPSPVPYFVEIDHEIISMVILLPSAESFKKGCK